MTVLYYLQAAFTIWMLVDAVRRRPDYYWYIVVFVPFGPLVYFFTFKIHDYDLRWLRRLLGADRPPPIETLRERLRQTPSFANRMRLANALHDAAEYAEAATTFEEILTTHADEPAALLGLGRCRIELGEPEAAIAPLAHLVTIDRGYRDFAACLDLAEAYSKNGRDDDAIELLEDVLRGSARVEIHLALGRHLIAAGRIERAQEVLQKAIDEHRSAPAFARKRDQSQVREAAALLKSISPKR
jgi:hypothetical protein